MFVQIINGRVKDADEVRRHDERWRKEVMPGAKGFLGSTVGVTDDNQFLAFVRFSDEAAARANSNRTVSYGSPVSGKLTRGPASENTRGTIAWRLRQGRLRAGDGGLGQRSGQSRKRSKHRRCSTSCAPALTCWARSRAGSTAGSSSTSPTSRAKRIAQG